MEERNYILPKSYRKIGWTFLILSAATLFSVTYLIWAKAVIIITPNSQKINQDFAFTIREGAASANLIADNTVNGKLSEIEVSGNANFAATGSKTLAEKDSKTETVGEVTIYNNYTKEQTLVATTRLASPDEPDKILVRLKTTVTVPAGKQVKVLVYPDNPVTFKEIKPTKLIIPGLWGPLREKIYAQNDETLSKGGYQVKVVSDTDLTKAEKALKDQLYQQALADFNKNLQSQEALWPKLVSVRSSETTYSAKVGDEVTEFTATMKLKAAIIVFDESQLVTLAKEKIKTGLPAGKQLLDLDAKSFNYSVQNYDPGAKQATVKVVFSGNSQISDPAGLFDASKLTGLTEAEVQAYFSRFSEVSSVEIKFHPSWLKKTPRFPEKIQIEIAN